ncbi:alpha-hydroxy acid oxidase [Enemella sp. A6]|uniref:alpha-hydroxy acid oxidase n=1 Tax=Enemella sp. A6 TaxID=3440152 RepID=UPI003EBEA01C
MVARRLPRPSELAPLLRLRPREPNATARRLARAHSIDDLRTIALRRTPRPVFDYVDGGADSEISMRHARTAFDAVRFQPKVLRDVSEVDTGTTILGKPAALPLVFGPTGFTRMMQHEGERAVGAVAERAGIPYALATMGTTTIEDLAAHAPAGRRWFQLYLWQDRERSKGFIDRAAAAGYDTLIMTVDVPTVGKHHRSLRSGLTIPPTLSLSTLANMARYPHWWLNVLTTEPLRFASSGEGAGYGKNVRMIDPGATFADLEWLRSHWPGTLLVKGTLRPDDARRVVDCGADGVIVSSHGGRQLDRTPAPIEVLPAMVAEVGDDAAVFLDGGVRNGGDLAAALCLGAQACFVGRPYLYGLMAGGERGVQRALEIFTTEFERTMRLLGVTTVGELDETLIRAH